MAFFRKYKVARQLEASRKKKREESPGRYRKFSDIEQQRLDIITSDRSGFLNAQETFLSQYYSSESPSTLRGCSSFKTERRSRPNLPEPDAEKRVVRAHSCGRAQSVTLNASLFESLKESSVDDFSFDGGNKNAGTNGSTPRKSLKEMFSRKSHEAYKSRILDSYGFGKSSSRENEPSPSNLWHANNENGLDQEKSRALRPDEEEGPPPYEDHPGNATILPPPLQYADMGQSTRATKTKVELSDQCYETINANRDLTFPANDDNARKGETLISASNITCELRFQLQENNTMENRSVIQGETPHDDSGCSVESSESMPDTVVQRVDASHTGGAAENIHQDRNMDKDNLTNGNEAILRVSDIHGELTDLSIVSGNLECNDSDLSHGFAQNHRVSIHGSTGFLSSPDLETKSDFSSDEIVSLSSDEVTSYLEDDRLLSTEEISAETVLQSEDSRQTNSEGNTEMSNNLNLSLNSPPEHCVDATYAQVSRKSRIGPVTDNNEEPVENHTRLGDKYIIKDKHKLETERASKENTIFCENLESGLDISTTSANTTITTTSDTSIDKMEGAIAKTSRRNSANSRRSSVLTDSGRPITEPFDHIVVVAIDFGTTFSGYGFSFCDNPEEIYMMKRTEGDPGINNQKIPTILLLTSEGEFDSFGFEARDKYNNMDSKTSAKWLYFDKFKMLLHNTAELTKETTVRSTNGIEFPALKVFAFALRYFRDCALPAISDQCGQTIFDDEVRWVITVPAIWKAPAKWFMRQAAYQAGISSPDFPDQLLIALEPEAASIYCRQLKIYQLSRDPAAMPSRLRPPHHQDPEPVNKALACVLKQGTRYMVVDCGGGTVDITVHEVEDERGSLKELYKATGGPYGSTCVDSQFEKLLCTIFGADFIDLYKRKRPMGWVDTMIVFESKKRSAHPYKSAYLNISLPISFIDVYRKTKGRESSAVFKHGDRDNVQWCNQGMLRLSPKAMRDLFQYTLDMIKASIGEVLNKPNTRGLQYMFLVGGFSDSPILQTELKQEFGDIIKLIIPQDVGLAVLRGAVMFGLDPTIVNLRKSRLTYGVGILNRFDPSKHPPGKLARYRGDNWCLDIFDKFVITDQSLAIGDTVIRSYTPPNPEQKVIIINIYSSDKADVCFITDHGVRKCGTLCLDLSEIHLMPETSESEEGRNEVPKPPRRREIQTRMRFGDTEIHVSAMDQLTGKCVRASIEAIDFRST